MKIRRFIFGIFVFEGSTKEHEMFLSLPPGSYWKYPEGVFLIASSTEDAKVRAQVRIFGEAKNSPSGSEEFPRFRQEAIGNTPKGYF